MQPNKVVALGRAEKGVPQISRADPVSETGLLLEEIKRRK
jgi:hypothetical protein